MADVIGPNRYLPGNTYKPKPGAFCDEHPDRPAVKSVVGETDSFGSEIMELCQECVDNIQEHFEKTKEEEQRCGICKTMQKNVAAFRDPAEGLYGPVYYGCSSCRSKITDAFIDEE